MKRITEIELFKEDFKFSVGHFAIFSPTKRENLHGHNYNAYVSFKAEIEQNGMTVDYSIVKRHFKQLCEELNELFLIAANSKHLKFREDNKYHYIDFNGEEMIFLKRDIKMMPLENITVEELSSYFLDKFIETFVEKRHENIFHAKVRICSGPGQCGAAEWSK